MDQVHVVRHKVLVEGRSQRAVARELGLARVTVRKYLEQAAPVRRSEAAARPRPVWDAVAARVQTLLAESVRWTGGKQRLTAILRFMGAHPEGRDNAKGMKEYALFDSNFGQFARRRIAAKKGLDVQSELTW